MTSDFSNVYDDETRARAYAELEFPGTYYLAYRDLPEILAAHVRGKRAVDFGCGTGRSTRFLGRIGFAPVIGVDISDRMIARARERDPDGDYRLVSDGDLGGLSTGVHDLVQCVFTFDNIATLERKVALFRSLRELLNDGGRIVSLVSAPEIYVNEWASFSTKAYPQNREAASGDKVRIEMLDVEDRRPVEDILWTDEGYRQVFEHSGLDLLETYRPLARADEPFQWVSETEIPPWTIHVLAKREG